VSGTDLLVGAGIIVGLLVLRFWLLPRLGVPT
jgi:hypothetical protein